MAHSLHHITMFRVHVTIHRIVVQPVGCGAIFPRRPTYRDACLSCDLLRKLIGGCAPTRSRRWGGVNIVTLVCTRTL